jgi:hypothetical protein
MAYANSTPIYKIPYWSRGERSHGQSNYRAAQIVENQVRASGVILGNMSVVQEGTYSAAFATGASFVALSAAGAVPSLEGLVAGKYVSMTTTLTWLAIPDNVTAYLYAQTIESNIFLDTQQSTVQDRIVVPIWNTTGSTPSEALLLGVATTTGSAITLVSSVAAADNDVFVGGKPYGHRIAIPLDHPDLSVTAAKLANKSVQSRTLDLTSGVDIAGASLMRSGLDIQGVMTCQGMRGGIRTVTTSDTVLSTDMTILADATSGSTTLTLPSSPVGTFLFKKIDSSGNPVILNGNGSNIDGYSGLEFAGQNDAYTVCGDGYAWWVF